MTSPSVAPPASEGLAALLRPVLGRDIEVSGLQRLTGGASRETWAFRVGDEALILRRDPPARPGAPGAMRREADVMRACRRAGLRAPEVLVDDDGTLLGTAGLVMRRVPGETLARRIQRDERFAGARRTLVGDLGHFLAGLHTIDPAEVPGVAVTDPVGVWDRYANAAADRDDPSRTFAKAHEWLLANRPPQRTDVLIHGDLRLGNLIVGPERLEAVIDWELIHLGDPHEDLAWLCLKAWRFGEPLEVAGLGTVDELVAAYERAGGSTVDRELLHWWLVLKTLTWGIGCVLQAEIHRTGRVRSVDLAAVGRRAAEQEWDLIELLAPDACATAAAAPVDPPLPDEPGPYGRPTARELLDAVREFLVEQVVPNGDGVAAYQGRVAANVLDLVARELARPVTHRPGDDWGTLALEVRDRLLVAAPRHLGEGGA